MDRFKNFTEVAALTGNPRYFYPMERDIEKATRAFELHRHGEVHALEEEFLDKAGLMICAEALRRKDN